MSSINKDDMMLFAVLMVALFVTMIVAGITYIGANQLKEVSCETAGDLSNVWSGTTCDNSTAAAALPVNQSVGEVTVKAVTQIGVVETAIDVALGLLTLFIIVLVFAVLLKITVRFAKGFNE